MKTLAIVFLIVAAVALGADSALQRSNLAKVQGSLDDAQKQVLDQNTQINTFQGQMLLLKQQLAALKARNDQLSAVTAAPAAAVAMAPVAPVAQTPGAAPLQPMEAAMQVVTQYSTALVIIEGSKGVGSGFICKMGDHTYVITNAHVLCDNPGFKITSLTGKVFNIGGSELAMGRDIVRLEVTNADKAFDPVGDINTNAKIGDQLSVLGNADGAGVVKPVLGKIVGIGPDLVEVDAAFVPGNSGSPIIQLVSGKVLGLATYITERKVADGVQVETRRFGYRLDGITQWEPINWQAFFAQAAQLAAIETLSQDFIKMFGDSGHGLDFDPNSYASPALQRVVRSFDDAVKQNGRTLSPSDKKTLVAGFIADLRSVAHADILAFNKNTAYDYFRREIEDESRFREELYDGLTRDLQNQ